MPSLLNPYWNAQIPPTWVQQITNPPSGTNIFDDTNVITDSSGNSYHLIRRPAISPSPTSWGWVVVTKFSPSGSILWTKTINKDIGMGNEFNMPGSRAVFGIGPQGLVIVSGHTRVTSVSVPMYNKVICLNPDTGSLLWAKAVDYTSGFSNVQFAGMAVNSVTGHTYLFMSLNNDVFQSILTLNSSGVVTGALRLNTGSGGTKGAIVRPDGTVMFFGLNFYGGFSYYRQTFTIVLSADGSSTVSPLLYIGATSSDQTDMSKGVYTSAGSIIMCDSLFGRVYSLNPSGSSVTICKNLTAGTLPLQLAELSDGTIAYLAFMNQPLSYNNQWSGSPNPQNPVTGLRVLSSDLSSIVKARQSVVNSLTGFVDHARFCNGCIPSLDRFIGSPGGFSVTSMTLTPLVAIYPTLPTYSALSNQNTYAKFASATTTLPISTTSATLPTVTDPSISTTALTTGSSDYASSVVIADNTSYTWSYFSS